MIAIVSLISLITVVTLPFLDGMRLRSVVDSPSQTATNKAVAIVPVSGMSAIDENQFIITNSDAAIRLENNTSEQLLVTIKLTLIGPPCDIQTSATIYWEGQVLLQMTENEELVQMENQMKLNVNPNGFNLLPLKVTSNPCSIPDQAGVTYGSLRVDDLIISKT